MYTTNKLSRREPCRAISPLSTLALVLGAVFTLAPAAQADQVSGDDVCMGDLFPGKLNCTANDVTIAEATSVSPTTCIEGEYFQLDATFLVELSGGGANQTRYDLGLYFDIDGDLEGDGARGGVCSLNTISPGEPGYTPLDADLCGDISTKDNPLEPEITIIDVLCTDTDGDHLLNLPNCTSWRQPGANQECLDPTDAFPGTSSKCNCDDDFNVPVTVESGTATLKKTATEAVVTYAIVTDNTSVTRTLRLDALCDDMYGTIAGDGCEPGSLGSVKSTTCVVPQTLAPGDEPYPCTFDVQIAAPGSADPVVDTVTATLVDTKSNDTVYAVGEASATVHLPASP